MVISLTALRIGEKFKVLKSFQDFDGQKIIEGSRWTFKEFSYFPYHEGYTIYFEEGVIRLAGIDARNDYILRHTDEFFELVL